MWSHHLRNKNTLEEVYLLGYNTVWFVQSQLTFRRNMPPTSSGSKNKPSMKPALLPTSHWFLAWHMPRPWRWNGLHGVIRHRLSLHNPPLWKPWILQEYPSLLIPSSRNAQSVVQWADCPVAGNGWIHDHCLVYGEHLVRHTHRRDITRPCTGKTLRDENGGAWLEFGKGTKVSCRTEWTPLCLYCDVEALE
jgi:hypothetical protein